MTTPRIKIITWLCMLCMPLLLCSCNSLPKSLPILLEKNADSLDVEKNVTSQAIKTIATDVSFTVQLLEAARDALATIDATKLSDTEKKSLSQAQASIVSELKNLKKVVDTASGRADSISKTLQSAADALRLTQGMIEKNNARELLVKQAIEKITNKKKEELL